jgi:hypothetical protein
MSILPSLPTPNLPAQSLIPAPSGGQERVFTDGSFKGYRFHVALPTRDQQHGVNSLEKTYSKRLQLIKRALRDGADINIFGANEVAYSVEIEFHGPNYLAEFDSFYAITMGEDSAGVLILPDMPKAVLAVFEKMSVRSAASSGETLVVSASWIGAGSKPSKSLAELTDAATGDQVAAAAAATSRLEAASSKAQDVIRNNGFMKGVQSVYGKLSQGRSSINAVLKASNSQRKAVLDSVGNIQATLGLANSIGDRVLSFVTKKAASRTTLTAPTFEPESTIDAATGQQVADFAEPETVAAKADPLAKPSVVPTVEKEVPGIETPAGAELSLAKVADSLQKDAIALEELSGGRTEEITRAIGAVRSAIVDLASTVKPQMKVPYLTRVEMSIHEVLFVNGLSIDLTMRTLEKNPHLEDELAIPAGTVVYL